MTRNNNHTSKICFFFLGFCWPSLHIGLPLFFIRTDIKPSINVSTKKRISQGKLNSSYLTGRRKSRQNTDQMGELNSVIKTIDAYSYLVAAKLSEYKLWFLVFLKKSKYNFNRIHIYTYVAFFRELRKLYQLKH